MHPVPAIATTAVLMRGANWWSGEASNAVSLSIIRRGVNDTEDDFEAAFDAAGEASGRGMENSSDSNGVRSAMS